MATPKIRIKLKAFDHRSLDSSVSKLVETVRRTGAKVAGPVPFPTRTRLLCVCCSPFTVLASCEHFEIRTHNRLIDIKSPTKSTIDSLMHLDLPTGVDIEIKTVGGR